MKAGVKSVNAAINGAKYKNGAGAPLVFGGFGAKAACKNPAGNAIVTVSIPPGPPMGRLTNFFQEEQRL